MKVTGLDEGQVTVDGTGIVSYAGVALIRALADSIGLTRGVPRALALGRLLVHHRAVLDAAIAALPPAFRRGLVITCDGAGASHDRITRLDSLAARPGCQAICSVSWELGKREKTAIAGVPAQAWQTAVDARGEARERRADKACGDLDCGHRRCWIEEAHVTELTSLLREGLAGDQLAAWSATMRIFARRQRPHPDARAAPSRPRDQERSTRGPWNPGNPGPPAGLLLSLEPRNTTHKRPDPTPPAHVGLGMNHRG